MGKTTSFNYLAITLIVIGIIFLLENLGFISGAWIFWPLLPLIIGAGFCLLYLRKRKDIFLLGTGCFITLNSIFFFYLNFTSWASLAFLWPVFIMILGVTFIFCFVASRSRVLMYLATILIAIGASFIIIFVVSTRLWPISLIFAGISFIIIDFFNRRGQRAR